MNSRGLLDILEKTDDCRFCQDLTAKLPARGRVEVLWWNKNINFSMTMYTFIHENVYIYP